MATDHYLKKELYELVKKDESIFNFIQQGSLDGLWYWDLEKPENEWMNERFWETLGYSPDEMPHISGAWQEIIDQNDLKTAVNNFNKHLKDPGHIYDQEVRYKHKNGSTVWVRCRGIAIRDESGKAVRMLGAHQDITSLKQSEEKLKESEAQFRLLFEQSAIGIARISPEGNFVKINKKFCDIVGYTKEELLNMSFSAITHPDDLVLDNQYIEKVFNNEIDEFTIQKRYIHKDQSIVWIRLYSNVVRDLNAGVLYAIASIIDITEQKKAEARLLKDQTLLEKAEEISDFGSFEMNVETKEFTFSPGWKKIHGISSDFLNIKKLMFVAHPDDRKSIEMAFDNAISNKKPYTLEHRIIRQTDKQVRTIKVSGKVIQNSNGVPVKMYGSVQDITDMRKAEKANTESEQWISMVFNDAPIGIGIVKNREIQFVNKEICNMLGYTEQELLQKNALILYKDQNEYDRVGKYKYSKIKNKGIASIETQFRKKDGSLIDVLMQTSMADPGNHEGGFISSVVNITDRKKAEIALKESENKFKSLFSLSPDAILLAEKDSGFIVDANNSAATLFEADLKNIIGLHQSELHPTDQSEKAKTTFSFKPENPDMPAPPVEIDILSRKNKRKTIEIRGKLFSISGRDYVLGNFRDITERKEAEAESRMLAEMLDTAPSSITVHDESGKFLYANQKTFQIHGYKPEEFMSLRLKELDTPESAKMIRERIEKIKKNGSAIFEVQHLRKDGSSIPLEVYVKFVSWKGFPAMLSVATDLSERKKWESELIKSKEKAEDANRLKTEFLNNMSHEIRTPMNGIIGFSELLNKQDITSEKRSYYTKIIQSSSTQLLKIIDDILEISTLETKQLKLNEETFNLNDNLMQLFSIFSIKSRESNINIYVKKPLKDSQSNILCDKTKLNKIVSNLIENALKYTNEGYIEIGYFTKKDILTIYVKDTGIGISPKNQQLIFERFAQENMELSRKHGGLGLGLAISKENARLLGGDIVVKSQKGKGSTFYVKIPYQPTNQTSALDVTPLKPPVNDEKLTILVAEDDEVNVIFLEALLEEGNWEYSLIHAKNGKEAVDICKFNPSVSFILMDLKMPVMDGFQATRLIKKQRPDLPVIAQSAYTMLSDMNKAMEAGCNDYLSKPIDKKEFLRIIGKYINKRDENIHDAVEN